MSARGAGKIAVFRVVNVSGSYVEQVRKASFRVWREPRTGRQDDALVDGTLSRTMRCERAVMVSSVQLHAAAIHLADAYGWP
jgi:hypothetical protein